MSHCGEPPRTSRARVAITSKGVLKGFDDSCNPCFCIPKAEATGKGMQGNPSTLTRLILNDLGMCKAEVPQLGPNALGKESMQLVYLRRNHRGVTTPGNNSPNSELPAEKGPMSSNTNGRDDLPRLAACLRQCGQPLKITNRNGMHSLQWVYDIEISNL